MRFEERELKSYAEPIAAEDLNEGSVYFALNYVDDDMLIPTMETVVYVGRDFEAGDSGVVYFQDIRSYREGIRYGTPTELNYAEFFCGSEREVSHIFTYERALEELMKCALRRRKAEQRER